MDNARISRVASIDILRGLVMILMALDHTRDYFSNFPYNPTDLGHTHTAMFFTRWITHFCAPVFVFLAGTSAFLSLQRGKSKKSMSSQLLFRGLWLIVLELTIIRWGWVFNLDYTTVFVQVIWAIGWSMICLSMLIWLPYRIIFLFSILMIGGHNMLDRMEFANNGNLWGILHSGGDIKLFESINVWVMYPLIPWIAVMSAGYCFGRIYTLPASDRNPWIYGIGLSAIALFILIRFWNIYGDPSPWEIQETGWFTFLSFLNCTKYPPSLCYLLMTLGPAIVSLPLWEKLPASINRLLAVYGKVPLFYYILHIYLIHALALLLAAILGFPISIFTDGSWNFYEYGWGYGLAGVYFFWVLVVALLYYPCYRFMLIKIHSKKWWLSYL